MQYESYREKMKRVAAFLGRIYAHKVPVIVGFVVLLAILGGLMTIKGTVLYESECPTEVEYGDKLGYRVYAVLCFTKYEYTPVGTSQWSREAPIYPGDYEVRGVTSAALGQKIYTEAHTFTVIPRTVTVRVAESSIDYGEEPTAKANLARGDELHCTISFSSRYERNPTVWVEPYSVRITSKDGEDRTHCYRIETPSSTLRINPIKLKVTVSDASKVFDDIKLSYDAYEVSGGKLYKGDSLVAVFYASITEAGSIANTPTLHIYNQAGADVTAFYELDIRSGKLTVEKRSLILRSGSKSYVYDGTPHDYLDYSIDPSTPLVDGHQLNVLYGATITDVGKVDNALTVSIRNARGADRTSSYSVFVEAGTLTVTPRSVTVRTPSASLVYDATLQSVTQGIRVDNGVGDTVQAKDPVTLRDVGSIENRMSVTFHRDGKDVTGNYEIRYEFGTLTVTKRPIHVKIKDISREYNGQSLTSAAYMCDTSRGYSMPVADTLTLKTIGMITRVGTEKNRYVDGSVEIRNKNGESVLSNYEVTVEDGTLTVTPRVITVSSASDSWVYDGTAKRNHTFEVTNGSLVEGQTLTTEVITECINVGVYQNLMDTTLTRVYDGKDDVTDQYNITYAYGRLKITGRPITVHTESGEWMYDGNAHSIPSTKAVWLDTETPLLSGHTIEFSGGATIISATTIPNTYTAHIYDKYGQEMTKNYEITYKTGTLTVHPLPIIVYTGAGTRTYNGRSAVIGEPVLTSDSPYALLSGHTLRVGSWDTDGFIDVGDYENVYKVAITDSDWLDVTGNYDITYQYGSLSITPRRVEFDANFTEVYTGLRFVQLDITPVNGTTLGNGDHAEAVLQLLQTNVGTYDTDVSILIQDQNGRNVTHNYNFNCNTGTLTITPRNISITTASAIKVYDGTPLEAPEVELMVGSLPLGYQHTIELNVTGSGTEVGVYPNTADFGSLRILNEYGNEVTSNYVIDHMVEGILTVQYDAEVTVTTGSATKAYDGLPLRDSSYKMEITSGELPAGFAVDVRTTGAITMPGSTDNTAKVIVWNAHGENVTALVPVIIRPGTLTVTERTDADPTENGSFRSSIPGTYYLRLAAYGDFTGQDWMEAEPYPYAEDVAFLPARVLSTLGMDSVRLAFSDAKRYLFPYYVHEDSATRPTTDTVMEEVPPTRYTVETTLYDGDLSWIAAYRELPEAYRAVLLGSGYEAEMSYRAFVYKCYLTLDVETMDYMQDVIDKNGLDASSIDIVTQVAKYIRSAADYNEAYDPALDRETNVAIAFLSKYREGTDRHFATAATLLYRALGIPARYVTGFRETIHEANDTVHIENEYSWVEVYVDGLGWVQVDVTGETKTEIDDRPVLELEPAFAGKVYDGQALMAPNKLTMTTTLEALLKQGYSYSVQIIGSLTEVGVSESTIMNFTLYDAKGRDVTSQYQLQKKNGLLRVVSEDAVIVMLHQLEKTYDGTRLAYGTGDHQLFSVPEGVNVDLELTISMVDVGVMTLNTLNRDAEKYLSVYRVTRNGRDVTESHPILFVLSDMDVGDEDLPEDGATVTRTDVAAPALIIKPRAIELTAASAIRMDDGTPLSDSRVELTRGQIVAGHTLVAVAVGTCTEPGTVANVVGGARILDSDGRDVTAFYTIACISGTLTIVGEDDY